MTHPIDEAVKAEAIAQAIVDRFAWSSNVMRNGRLVGQQAVVADVIAEAIETDRKRTADLITAQAAQIEALETRENVLLTLIGGAANTLRQLSVGAASVAIAAKVADALELSAHSTLKDKQKD